MIDWSLPWGLVSDAHGNPVGLRESLGALRKRGVGTVFFLGDALGYLPHVAGVLNILREEGAICLKGNHEAMALGDLPMDARREDVYALQPARNALGATDLAYINDWPDRIWLTEPRSGRRILLVHGGMPEPLTTYTYPDSPVSALVDSGADVVFCGHTHRPFVKKSHNLHVVNVGSCGLPRDIGNLASCVIYDALSDTAEIIRVEFDAEEVIASCDTFRPLHASVRDCLRRGQQ